MTKEQEGLVDPQGQPLIKERKLVVVKIPKGAKMPAQVIEFIAKQTGYDVITLPMTSEILMGNMAGNELMASHSSIHAVLGIPQLNFTMPELNIIRNAVEFLCRQTAPSDDGPEVALLKRLI